MRVQTLVNFSCESCAIPFDDIIQAINKMAYGSVVRVMFLMCAVTGCRIDELDHLKWSLIFHQEGKFWLYWRLGKNQKGQTRKEELPLWFIDELRHYRDHNKVFADRLFAIDHKTFKRYFNRYRQTLGGRWLEHTIHIKGGIMQREYLYQLKGLRKSFATLTFKREFDKWQNAEVALQFTSQKMKHSSTHMTSYHYIRNFETLNIERFKNLSVTEIIKNSSQRRLVEFQP